jgi:inosine-uridine nucleoside N-ribohydrolase
VLISDAAALLLAATSSRVNLLAVNINVASSYSALAASALLAYYGHSYTEVPVGIRRPLTNESFFDAWTFELGEYASKVAYHYADPNRGSLAWKDVGDAWDPVTLYRRVLAGAEDESVTIVSIGFLENVCTASTHPTPFHTTISSPITLCSGPYFRDKLINYDGSYLDC